MAMIFALAAMIGVPPVLDEKFLQAMSADVAYCSNGVTRVFGTKADVCCPASCGTCGGSQCNQRPGGDECCVNYVKASKKMCMSAEDVACVIPEGFCSLGVRKTFYAKPDVCCPASCGICGGPLCSLRPGGDECCEDFITASKKVCTTEADTACTIYEEAYVTSLSGTAADFCSAGTGIKKEFAPQVGPSVCCAASCGACGGVGCSNFTGGKMKCCTSNIQETEVSCHNATSVACVIPTGIPLPLKVPLEEPEGTVNF